MALDWKPGPEGRMTLAQRGVAGEVPEGQPNAEFSPSAPVARGDHTVKGMGASLNKMSMELKTRWEKLVWTWRPKSEREAGDSVVRNLLLHWFPAKINIGSLSF